MLTLVTNQGVDRMTSSPAPQSHLNHSISSSSVLFVSESTDEVEMYSAALELSGFRTMHVRTPLQALQVSGVETIAVILDAGRSRRIPDSAQYLGLKARLQVPLILLTTQVGGSDGDTQRRVGCERVLVKPCLPDALVHALEDLLDRFDSADVDDRGAQ